MKLQVCFTLLVLFLNGMCDSTSAPNTPTVAPSSSAATPTTTKTQTATTVAPKSPTSPTTSSKPSTPPSTTTVNRNSASTNGTTTVVTPSSGVKITTSGDDETTGHSSTLSSASPTSHSTTTVPTTTSTQAGSSTNSMSTSAATTAKPKSTPTSSPTTATPPTTTKKNTTPSTPPSPSSATTKSSTSGQETSSSGATVTPTKATTPTTTSTKTTLTTTTPTTTTQATSKTPTTPTPQPVMISESNLLLASNDSFVELKVPSNSLDGVTLVIYNAETASAVLKKTYNANTTVDDTKLYVEPVDQTTQANVTSVAVVVYPRGANTSQFTGMDDFLVYSKAANAGVAKKIKEALLPNGAPLPLVSQGDGTMFSMSRNKETLKDTSSFVLTKASKGKDNNVTLTSQKGGVLQLRKTDGYCKAGQDTIDQSLTNALLTAVSKMCICGLTSQQLVGSLKCQRDLFFNFTINESYSGQASKFRAAFQQYVQKNETLTVDGTTYKVVNCSHDCMNTGHHQPPRNSGDNGNIRVTVAVVLSCIVVFLLILVSVIFYMRRKRRGIMRQFRMTRLQEDDDMDDMDDFVGGGYDQEPSFTSSRSNLTN